MAKKRRKDENIIVCLLLSTTHYLLVMSIRVGGLYENVFLHPPGSVSHFSQF